GREGAGASPRGTGRPGSAPETRARGRRGGRGRSGGSRLGGGVDTCSSSSSFSAEALKRRPFGAGPHSPGPSLPPHSPQPGERGERPSNLFPLPVGGSAVGEGQGEGPPRKGRCLLAGLAPTAS